MAAMQVLMTSATLADAQAALRVAQASLGPARHAAIAKLIDARAFAAVRGVLAAVDHDPIDDASPQANLARIAAAFDQAARVSPEASVALYSLGDPALLATASEEIVAVLRDWSLLGPQRRVLEVGCGIGRLLAPMAPHVGFALGLDISAEMVAEARRRTRGLASVAVARSGGADLACIADACADLVLFADSFPYLVQAGGELATRHIADSARVLRPGGRLLILNLSYRGDSALDEHDLRSWCEAAGLTVLRAGERPFQSWDGAAFLMSR